MDKEQGVGQGASKEQDRVEGHVDMIFDDANTIEQPIGEKQNVHQKENLESKKEERLVASSYSSHSTRSHVLR